MRGGRSLDELNRLAAAAASDSQLRFRGGREGNTSAASSKVGAKAKRSDGGKGTGQGVVFLAVCIDPIPTTAQHHAPAQWPSLRHYWIDGTSIGELDIGFVPNRVVVDGRRQNGGLPKVLRWWDGTSGNVLKGPHGKSRGNGSHRLLDELRMVISGHAL